MRDVVETEKAIDQVDKIRHEVNTVPWQLSNFHRVKSQYHLYLLEEKMRRPDKTMIFEYQKNAKKSCELFFKVSRKVAQHRVESTKLLGVYYWLMGKQKKALRWWSKSIKEGERMGANLELSRTFWEVGTRLQESNSSYKMLDGITAEGYLNKARILFKEMDLQKDIDELDQLTKA
jgi:hypothetical protein